MSPILSVLVLVLTANGSPCASTSAECKRFAFISDSSIKKIISLMTEFEKRTKRSTLLRERERERERERKAREIASKTSKSYDELNDQPRRK